MLGPHKQWIYFAFILLFLFKIKSNQKAAEQEQKPSLTQSVCVCVGACVYLWLCMCVCACVCKRERDVAALWVPPGLSKPYCPHTLNTQTCTCTHPWGQGIKVQVEALTAQQLQVRQTCCTHMHTRTHTNVHAQTYQEGKPTYTTKWKSKIKLSEHTHCM